MSWDALGAIAEMVGALAVISTLLFLAVQVRHGSKSLDQQNALAEVDSVTRSVELMNQWRHMLSTNREITELWRKGLRQEELDDIDQYRFDELGRFFCQIMHAIYFQNLMTGRDAAAKGVVRTQAHLIETHPGYGALWKRNPLAFDPSLTGLKEEIERTIKNSDDT